MADPGARAQANYHRSLYEALWNERAAADAAAGTGLTGLDQMGHFGTAGCQLVAEALTRHLAGRPAAVLELGCGFGGALRDVLRRLDGAVTVRLAVGVDLVWEHTRVMRRMQAALSTADSAARAAVVCGSASSLGLRAEVFDAVFATGSVSHFPDMAATLAEAFRVLRPGGVLSFVEEVSLFDAPPSDRFRQSHPRQVFAASSWPERRRELASCGFADIEPVDLRDWATNLLTKRLLGMRIYRSQLSDCYGAEATAEIVAILTAARDEVAAGRLTPLHVTARRPPAPAAVPARGWAASPGRAGRRAWPGQRFRR
jgi:SAM-dependent methyltransferase